jgi:transcriptional regulator with XRE-family HTH domain
MNLSNIIRDARKSPGLTQRVLAVEAGVSERTIMDIEKGRRNITVKPLFRLIWALRIPADDIFCPDKPPPTPKQRRFVGAFSEASPAQQETIMAVARVIMRSEGEERQTARDVKMVYTIPTIR